MSCVNIRGCCIGEGRPKVIIPIVEPTETAVLEKAAEFSTLRADCVEWRIDCFEGAKDLPAIVHCAAKLRVACSSAKYFLQSPQYQYSMFPFSFSVAALDTMCLRLLWFDES